MSDSRKGIGASRLLSKAFSLMLGRFPKEAAMIVAFAIAGSALAGMTTLGWRRLFNDVNSLIEDHASVGVVFLSLFLLAGVYSIQRLLEMVSTLYQPRFMEYIKLSILGEIHDRADTTDLESYEDPSLYDSVHRANDIVSSGKFLRFFQNGMAALQQIVTVVGVSIVLISFSRWLIVICLIGVIPPFIARVIRGTRYYYLKVHQTPKARMRDYLWSLLTTKDSLKEARVFGFGEYLKDRWAECKAELQNEEWEFTRKHGWIQFAVDGSKILGLGVGILLLVWLRVEDRIEIGAFGAALTGIQTVQASFNGFLVQLALASEKAPFVSDLLAFLYERKSDDGGGMAFERLTGGIELDNVSFSYPGTQKTVLSNINLRVEKGETIALIGYNGAGKTTLAKLILGLYRPVEGSVRYDGVDLWRYDRRSVYAQTSAVYQDYAKYQLSLRENIGFGDLSAIDDDARIVAAIEQVGLNDLLARLPGGLDSQLGKEFGGAELSGGEWQKVAIARCLMSNGCIVVLDEPTAFLDPVIESEIFRRFAELSEDKTTILISHRVGPARMADRIVVLDEGRIVEVGCHEELMSRKGLYNRLFNLQAQWYVA